MDLLQELCWIAIVLGDTGVRVRIVFVVPVIVTDLRSRMDTFRAGLLAVRQRGGDRSLEERIRFAGSEEELEDLVEEVQAEFEAGRLSQAQADRLTYLVIDIARQLTRGLANMPAGEQ